MTTKLKVTFLGTNGWYSTDTGNTVSTVIESEDYYLILDAGEGFSKIDTHILGKKPIYIFLSHFHLDHIVGLHTLCKNNFTQGVNICGPKGTEQRLRRVITHPYTGTFEELGFPVRFIELAEGENDLGFLVTMRELVHSSPCFGYRFELGEKIVTYCSDTGPCENLNILSKNSDLAIYECSLLTGEVNDDWPHLNPEDSARVAAEAKVKKVMLSHFNAFLYKSIKSREVALENAKKIFPDIDIATDNLSIILP